jgi:hypothetical protein
VLKSDDVQPTEYVREHGHLLLLDSHAGTDPSFSDLLLGSALSLLHMKQITCLAVFMTAKKK